MSNTRRIASVVAAACLCPLAAGAQSAHAFDYARFSDMPPAAVVKPAPTQTSFEIQGDGIAKPVNTGGSTTENTVKNGSLSADAGILQPISVVELSDLHLRTNTVHIGTGSKPTACGPSSASVEDIKGLITSAANKYGVDPDFALAVAWTESRFDQVRNSPKGARGAMQLMPDTARRFGVEDVCDPSQNIDGGMRYLRGLLDEFKNPIIAAAAYNAGEQSVYDNGGIPAYLETIRYVASVINHQFGLSIPVKRAKGGADQPEKSSVAVASDVIGARTPKFVGGVMQF